MVARDRWRRRSDADCIQDHRKAGVAGLVPFGRMRRARSRPAARTVADAEHGALDALGAIMKCRSRMGEEALLPAARYRA